MLICIDCRLAVSPSVFTTFFVGVREHRPGSGSVSRPESVHARQSLADRLSIASQPHILVLFSVSYGLDRKQLEEWNCRLQMGDSPTFVPYKSRAAVSPSVVHSASAPLCAL
jgi:hypothetical protein